MGRGALWRPQGELRRAQDPTLRSPKAHRTHRKVSEGRRDIKEEAEDRASRTHIPRRRKVSSRAVRSLSRSSTAQATLT